MATISNGTAPISGAGGNYITGANNMPIRPWAQAAALGYSWDPVRSGYVKAPAVAGKESYDYSNAATGGALSQTNQILGGLSGSASGSGGSSLMPAPGGQIPSFPGGAGATGAPGAGTSGAPGGSGAIAGLSMPDQSAVTSNAFNAAKDRAAQQSRASLTALNGELGATGMMGGGAQVQGTKDILQGAGQYVSDINRAASTSEAQTAADFAKTNYEGGIAQRGQDIGSATARRGQDVQYAEAQGSLALAEQQANRQYLSLILQGLNGKSGGYTSPLY